MNWKCPFCEAQISLPALECSRCKKHIPWEYCSITFDAGTQGQTSYHLFCARGTASDDSGLIPISNATPLLGDHQHFVRGDNVHRSQMDNPPQTPRNIVAVDTLREELHRQGYVNDPYNAHGTGWFEYKLRRIGSEKPTE